MTYTLLVLALATAVSTFLGGFFAIKHRDKWHLIVGFSAGAVIGVAFFDLLPEAIETTSKLYSAHAVIVITAIGFLVYMVMDRAIGIHMHSHEHTEHHEHTNRGTLRASSLSFHSFLDGLGIGLAFQVSATLGTIVAVAVLAHDFSDGINTVTAILKSGGTKVRAFKWLFVDALAPVLGIVVTLFFKAPEGILGLILALFAGFFFYIGASDLVPESYHSHPTKWTTFMTILGAAVIFIVIHIAG